MTTHPRVKKAIGETPNPEPATREAAAAQLARMKSGVLPAQS
jgi:hypothetical protein